MEQVRKLEHVNLPTESGLKILVGTEKLGNVYLSRKDEKSETGFSWGFIYHVGFPW